MGGVGERIEGVGERVGVGMGRLEEKFGEFEGRVFKKGKSGGEMPLTV